MERTCSRDHGERLLAFGQRGTAPGQFFHPTAVSVDCHGTLTVTDSESNRVQQFALAAPPAGSCSELGPVGNPPPPKLPTLPVPIGPQLSLRVLRTSGLTSSRTLPLRVACDTGCTLTVTGTVTPTARPAKHHKRVTVSFHRVKQQLGAGDSVIVRPSLSAFAAKQLRTALRAHRGLAVELELTATAPVGPPTTQAERVKATR